MATFRFAFRGGRRGAGDFLFSRENRTVTVPALCFVVFLAGLFVCFFQLNPYFESAP